MREAIELAQKYRAHALELRNALRNIKRPENRVTILAMAESYERLADNLELRLSGGRHHPDGESES